MLLRASIRRFKSCVNVEIDDIGAVTLLVGKNGAGKTNILRAIKWAAGVASLPLPNVPDEPFRDSESDVSLLVNVQGTVYEYSVFSQGSALNRDGQAVWSRLFREQLVIPLPDGQRRVIFDRHNGEVTFGPGELKLSIGENSPALRTLLAMLPDENAVRMGLALVAEFFSSVTYNSYDTPTTEISSGVLWEKDYEKLRLSASAPSANNLPSRTELQLLQLKKEKPDKYHELLHLVGPSGIGLISSFTIAEIGMPISPPGTDSLSGDSRDNRLYFFQWKTIGGEINCNYSDLSYGTRRLLSLFVSIFYRSDVLMLIEQPEDGIHSGLLHQILPILRSYGIGRQYFIASHSERIINDAHYSEVLLVSMGESGTDVRNLTTEEIDAAAAFAEDSGSLFDYLRLNEV